MFKEKSEPHTPLAIISSSATDPHTHTHKQHSAINSLPPIEQLQLSEVSAAATGLLLDEAEPPSLGTSSALSTVASEVVIVG